MLARSGRKQLPRRACKLSPAGRPGVTTHMEKFLLPKENIRIYITTEYICYETLSSVDARKTAAFEEIFLPHLDGAYNLARWIVERDPDAQAIVEEAYVQASRAFVECPKADARAWLLTIVRNIAYTWIKRRGNNSSAIPFEEAIHAAPSDKPQAGLFHVKRKRQLHEALTRLPVELREVLVLREIEGWSYKQLASTLNVPSATVMSRLIQARRRLRQEGRCCNALSQPSSARL